MLQNVRDVRTLNRGVLCIDCYKVTITTLKIIIYIQYVGGPNSSETTRISL